MGQLQENGGFEMISFPNPSSTGCQPVSPASPRAHNPTARLAVLPFLFALLFAVVPLHADLTISPQFISAQGSGRTYMDIGGAWNGSSVVSGDTVRLTIANDAIVRYEFGLAVELPAHFNYVPGTASLVSSSDATLTSVSASQSGNILTFAFPAGYDLPANASLVINYGLVTEATTSLTSGTYSQIIAASSAATDSGTPSQTATNTLGIFVRQGASTLLISPSQQTKAVGEEAEFTVTVTNTGLGALFDVEIDETALSSLLLTGMTQISPAPATRPATGSGSVRTLPYLASGESFSMTVKALVTNCGNILNTVSTRDRVNVTSQEADAAVALNLQQPLITYEPPHVALTYGAPVPVGPFNVASVSGYAGAAHNVVLSTNLHELGVTVSNITGGWQYADGIFTLQNNEADGKDITPANPAPLGFTLQATDACSGSPGGTVIWRSSYQNGCGDDYATPTTSSTISPPTGAPSINLSQSTAQRITVRDTAAFTVTLSTAHPSLIQNDTLTIVETLPAGVNIAVGIITATGGTFEYNAADRTVTWTVPRAAFAAGTATLTIPFIPQDPCDAGVEYTATANIVAPATSTAGCDLLPPPASATFFLSNNPVDTVNQYFDVTASSDGTFETGLASTANSTREIAAGEGEFVPFEAHYSFDAGYIGAWTGSIYTDDFGGSGVVGHQTLVSGTLQYSLNNGISWTAINSADYTYSTATGLEIRLAFLGVGDDTVGGKDLRIRYQTTLRDAALGVEDNNTRTLLQTAQLKVAGADSTATGACVTQQTQFRQGVYYTIARAAASAGLGLSTNNPALCEVIDATVTVSNLTAKHARNLRIAVNLGSHYEFLPVGSGQNITYSGGFSGSSLALTGAPAAPVFTYSGGSNGTPLTQTSTVSFKVRLKPSAPTIAPPPALSATVHYDDLETWSLSPGDTQFVSTASTSPLFVRSAQLSIRATPDTVVVAGKKVQWTIYVTNTGDGTAYDSQLTNTLIDALELDETATNTANASNPVTVVGQQIGWPLGNIPSGGVITRVVVATVKGTDCSFNLGGGNQIKASWGCGDTTKTVEVATTPKYTVPPGKMLVAHDTTNSIARLCGDGEIIIIVRNTGASDIHNVVVTETLHASMNFKPDTVQYSLDGGAWTSTANPIGSGLYQWSSAQISALARLRHAGASSEGGTVPQEIRIRFAVTAGNTFAASSPTATATATGQIACGSAAESPGAGAASISTEKPVVTVTKTGRNVTAGQSSGNFTETVHGGRGDTIEWKIVVENSGNATAQNLRFSDQLSGTGGAAVISSTDDPGTNFINNSSLTANTPISLSNLPAGTTRVYYITEILGATCVTSDANPNAEASWGCSAVSSGHNDTSAPGIPIDSARLVLTPAIANNAEISQTIDYLPGGRARITATIINNGGNAYNLVVTNTFPNAQMVLDETPSTVVAVVHDRLSGSPYSGVPIERVTSVTVDNTNTLAPKFTLVGSGGSPFTGNHILRYGDRITLTYYVRPVVFDTQYATTFPQLAQQDSTSSRDPAYPASGKNTVKVDYQNSCEFPSSNQKQDDIDLKSPNLDITASSADNVLSPDDAAVTHTFTVQNVGEPDSIADFISFKLRVGKGWSASAPTISVAGSTISGPSNQGAYNEYTITLPAGYTLARNGSPSITITLASAKVLNTGGELILLLEALGEARGQSGATLAGGPFHYSRDHRAIRTLGVILAKTLLNTSEGASAGSTVFIGEEATFRISARFFGAEATAASGGITGITLRDTPATGGSGSNSTGSANHRGLAYVSHTVLGSSMTPTATSAPTAIATTTNGGARSQNRVTFTLPDIGSAATLGVNTAENTFEANIITRVLNITNNVNNKPLRNNLGLQFTYGGVTFRSSNADDEYSGNIALDSLHKDVSVTVSRPATPTITKQVRNRGPAGTDTPAFANSITGAQAGDVIEYRIVVTAASTANSSLFSLQIEDDVPAKVALRPLSEGVHGYVPNATATTGVSAPGGSITGNKITFNKDNLNFNTPGTNLTQLNASQVVRFLYRGVLTADVTPSELITNTAKVSAYTVPVDNVTRQAISQTAPKGIAAEGNADPATQPAALIHVPTAIATVTIAPVTIVGTQKRIIATSVKGATGTSPSTVQIGEQIRYEIGLIVPKGTVPRLQLYDQLPAGLALIGLEAVTFGSAFADTTPPAITPSGVPLSGDPLQITWDFGVNRLVSDGTVADRTVTLRYVAQVRNVLFNQQTTTLKNTAQFSTATGEDPTKTGITSVTVTVAEPQITLTRQVKNVTREGSFAATATADAGDVLEYQVTLTNANGANVSPAYDLALVDTLPLGVTYRASSTTGGITTNPQVSGDSSSGYIFTWGRTRTDIADNLDLAANSTLTFAYQVTVDDSSRPSQVYTSNLVADWTSLDGGDTTVLSGYTLNAPSDALGERTGADGLSGGGSLNDYRATVSNTVTALNSTGVAKTKSGDTLPRAADDTVFSPSSGFRIGDIITYTVTATVQEGSLKDFEVRDTLPAGLAFIATDSINGSAVDAAAAAPFAYNALVVGGDAPTAPAANATGAIAWKFKNADGNLVNTGDNDTNNDKLTIVYRARVIDTNTDSPGTTAILAPSDSNPITVSRNNSATAAYKLATGADHVTDARIAGVEVRQPLLTLTRVAIDPNSDCSPNVLRPGQTGTFKLTASNTGSAPAYNVILTETLPDLLRTVPINVAIKLNDTTFDIGGIAAVYGYNSSTGVLTVTLAGNQPLLPGKTLELTYTYTVDASAPKGTLITPITGTVTEYYSLPAGLAEPPGITHRRQYKPASAEASSLIVGLEIKGYVYNDIEPNGHRDGFENWNAGPKVFINLVNSSNQVCRSVEVLAGLLGDFTIPRIEPGTYRIILTNSASSITAAAPTGWLFRAPVDGIRPVTLGVVDLQEENFGLYQGTGALTGTVFKDTGIGGGIANNGKQDGGEPGIAGVTVRLLSGSEELDRATTDSAGKFALYVPASVTANTTLIIEETNPSGHVSTGASWPAVPGVSYDRASDRITFTYNPTGWMDGFNFGDVPVGQFLTDGAQTILPGSAAFYRHTFIAGTAGRVSFSPANSAAPANVPWMQVILSDPGCNGTPGSVLLPSDEITVTAGQTVCIILKESSPAGAPYGAVTTTTVTATFAYTGATPAMTPATLTRQDVTTIGIASSAGLKLTKEVDLATALPGAVIEYTIIYTNVGAEALKDLFIYDSTPAYTTFVEASVVAPPPADLESATYIITGPGGSATGASLTGSGTGGIKWEFKGTLAPGGEGKVKFKVRVQQ